MSPSQGFVDRIDQFFVIQDLVGLLHPWFPPILDRRIEKALSDLPLSVVSFDHGSQHRPPHSSAPVRSRSKITFRHCSPEVAYARAVFEALFLRRKVIRLLYTSVNATPFSVNFALLEIGKSWFREADTRASPRKRARSELFDFLFFGSGVE